VRALALLDLLTGWTLFLSLALATGAVALRWIVLPTAAPGLPPTLADGRVEAARIGMRATWLLFLSLGLVLARQLVEFHDPFAPWGDDARLLVGGTAWGTTWSAAPVVALLAVGGFALARRDTRGGWTLATLAVLALGAFPALTGHANAGGLRRVTLVADTLHVWAMGAWIGTLAGVLLLERRHRRARDPEDEESLLPALVPRFSPVAVTAVSTLLVTGVIAAWIHLGSVGALFGTSYGRLLLVKMGLVLGVLGLGVWNWRRLTPLLSEPGGQGGMRRAATLEFLVANVVILVTALLVRTSPG
jgi:putative copper export protein